MSIAYACRLIEVNYGAIKSEKPGFDLEETRAWVETHGDGFFVRDEDYKVFDCEYIADVAFHQMYAFESFRQNEIFHRLVRLF